MKKDLRTSKQQTVPQPGFVPGILSVVSKAVAASMVLRVLLGIGLVFVSAQIQIPIKPVPITMQTVAVMILALCYKKKEAMQAIVGYVAFGAMGLPLFAGFSTGLPILLGTTGGYLFGMILCVYVL